MIFNTLNLPPSSLRPWYPLTSPLRIQLSLRILLLIFTFPCSNTLISCRQSLLFSNTDNRGEAPLRISLADGNNFFFFETGRPPGARTPLSIKMSDTPKDGSPLSGRRHSDKSMFSFSVYVTPMTQVSGRPPGTIKLSGTQRPTFLHTPICQGTGRPTGNTYSHLA